MGNRFPLNQPYGQLAAPFRQPSFVTPGTIWCDQSNVEFSAKLRAPNSTPLSSQTGWRTTDRLVDVVKMAVHAKQFAGPSDSGINEKSGQSMATGVNHNQLGKTNYQRDETLVYSSKR
jgi:hypothetical protein